MILKGENIMEKDVKFFVCKHCGNLVGMINNSGVPLMCCGQKMEELTANTVDASTEKHIPVVEVSGNTVTAVVGSVIHPMAEDHSIKWIYLSTQKGGQRKNLKPGDEPKAVFEVVDDKPLSVYAYCDLHGLWKADI